MKRSKVEWAFVILFIPTIVLFYAIYKYPEVFLGGGADTRLLGKSLSFWYMLVYTGVVCAIAGRALLKDLNVYSFKAVLPTGMSSYQRSKFTSIFWVQLVGFFLVPFVILPLARGASFWDDPIAAPVKTAHIYLFPAFTNWGMAAYLFVVIPVFVYFFGKRYCSWICSCGNLAETVGITTWGKKWVKEGTPRGDRANRNHWISRLIMTFAFAFGLILLFDSMRVIAAPSLVDSLRSLQDFGVDFMFGSVIGVGAYPFFGTRIWCRYGCPLAKFMELSGKYSRSKFQVAANEKCTGIGLCTKACPMGIDVASFAHKDRKPILGSFGLQNSVCIGCGGCIDVCPTKALSFKKLRQILETPMQIVLSVILSAQIGYSDSFDIKHTAWNNWLKRFTTVSGPVTTVAYKGAKNDSTLAPYTDLVQAFPKAQFDALGEKDRLAFLINAYNALTVQWILQNYPVKSIKDTGSLFSSPWKKKFFKLFGEDQNLDGIEHGIIRKTFNEPRIHFAVVCASKGCPALAGTAYVAAKLEEQLEAGTRLFLSDKTRNYYDAKENRFYLSKIFDWYGDDFKNGDARAVADAGGEVKSAAGTVQAFVAKRMAKDVTEEKLMQAASIKYLDYDWSLNGG